ncbi:hypothetical protein AURDEDRAFT_161253 [Auricularia subglabra TFB-10046 SS5]|nr:hypothetical protein AURDEDRAFT_161253 [Auricularia subglabra TFB-10046 SS5]
MSSLAAAPAAERITRPLRKMAVASTTTCAASAKAYGACVAASYQDARQDMCSAEFARFKDCVQTAMKRKW